MSLPPLPPGATLDAPSELPPLPPGARLDSSMEPDTFKSRGVRQPDGTWLVQTPDGPVRLDDAGNLVETVEDRDLKRQLATAQTREGVLNRVLATAQGGAQHFVPQLAGLAEASKGGDYEEGKARARKSIDTAIKDAGIGYELAGGLLSSGVAAPETAAARIALGAGLGAANAAAESDLDMAEALKGAALGGGLGVAGEALGAGVRKVATKLTERAASAVARQTAKDAAAVEKEIASLTGTLGAEKQKASRLLENIQRAATGVPETGAPVAVGGQVQAEALELLRSEGAHDVAESIVRRAMEDFPGQKAVVDQLAGELAAAKAAGPKKALDATAAYFAAPIWQTEVLPRLKTLAPRFGLAAASWAMGHAVDLATGDSGAGRMGAAAAMGAILGAPGVRQMIKNVAASNRVQFALGTRLAPLLDQASRLIVAGVTPTAQALAPLILREEHLGNTDLAAEQLVARGGLSSVLGDHAPDVGEVTGVNAPGTELDAAIHQTAAIVGLGGALEAHHAAIDRGVKGFLKGEKPPPSKDVPHEDLAPLAADAGRMAERLGANLGSLSSVAPGVASSMAGVADRAVQYLAKLASTPPPRGPLGVQWQPSSTEKRLLAVARAVANSPLILLEHAARGTLSGEHMKAATSIYPALTRAIGDRALDAAIEAKSTLTRQQRLMLSLLAGVDVDGSLASVATSQRTIQARRGKPSNDPGGGADGAKADKLTLGARTALPHSQDDTEE